MNKTETDRKRQKAKNKWILQIRSFFSFLKRWSTLPTAQMLRPTTIIRSPLVPICRLLSTKSTLSLLFGRLRIRSKRWSGFKVVLRPMNLSSLVWVLQARQSEDSSNGGNAVTEVTVRVPMKVLRHPDCQPVGAYQPLKPRLTAPDLQVLFQFYLLHLQHQTTSKTSKTRLKSSKTEFRTNWLKKKQLWQSWIDF